MCDYISINYFDRQIQSLNNSGHAVYSSCVSDELVTSNLKKCLMSVCSRIDIKIIDVIYWLQR